jgi:hypothetical protein
MMRRRNMNNSQKKNEGGFSDAIIQDGISCPQEPPWNPIVSKIAGLPLIPMIALGIYVTYEAGPIKLILWLLALGILIYPLRYLVCARCPYYGKDCSTSFGRIVPHFFKKQEGKSMKTGLWLDVVFMTFLFLYPLPEVWRKGFLFTLLWFGFFMLFFGVITRLACSLCPFTFCPIGKAGRKFWGWFGKSRSG